MRTAIILHGKPSREDYFNVEREDAQSNAHWLPWIQRQLLLNGILTQALELPEPYEPVYENWKLVFERFDVNKDTILIGHSCGAGFLIRWLSENKVNVGKVALVAPWLDPDHKLSTGFFNFEIDTEVPKRTADVSIFISSDDDSEGDIGTREFPELKELLLG